ncbi:MAG: radical SAM protein [Exilispira sp.]|jgi:spore photoproduct lyase|nr:radical SAM protein [Exilispira sp.]
MSKIFSKLPKIKNIYIEKGNYNNFQSNNIENIINNILKLKRNTNEKIKINYLENEEIINLTKQNKISQEDSYDLIIQKNPGIYIKKCPGTPNYICCNYHITTFYVNCNLGCTYCFLKFYLKNNNIIIYYDIDLFLEEINRFDELRLGSGELSDSLLYDPFTNYSDIVMEYLENKPKITFEFKTKTDYIDPFLKRKPLSNIVVGFSVNPENISKILEPLSSTLNERLEAASILLKNGWKVSFHFDPIILTLGLDENEYLKLFNTIIDLAGNSIAWFSLGTLRYNIDMMEDLRKSYKGRILLKYETIKGLDGKIRYFIDDRLRIYRKIFDIYKNRNCTFPLYYCMESDKIYLKTFGKLPNKIDNLSNIFNFNC